MDEFVCIFPCVLSDFKFCCFKKGDPCDGGP